MSFNIQIREISVFIAFFCLLAAVPSGWAQTATGEINGTIRDQTGAVLPGVELVLRNVETGVDRNSISRDNGIYVIPSVLAGLYELRATLTGFQNVVFGEFRLQINEARTVDIEMQLGQVSDQVTVTAQANPINKTNATISTVIQNKEMVEIPLNGRHFSQLSILSPGVAPIQTGQQNLFTIALLHGSGRRWNSPFPKR